MPVTWFTVVVRRPNRVTAVPLVTVCLLAISGIISFFYIRNVGVALSSTLPRCLVSPLVHVDYLHLCVNLLGALLVLGRIEENNGWRQTIFVVCLSYGLHVLILALITAVFVTSVDIIGLSFIIYTAMGYYFQANVHMLSIKARASFTMFIVLMLILDVEIRSSVVHLVALALGFVMSFAMTHFLCKLKGMDFKEPNNELS